MRGVDDQITFSMGDDVKLICCQANRTITSGTLAAVEFVDIAGHVDQHHVVRRKHLNQVRQTQGSESG